MFQKEVVEKLKTHALYQIIFSENSAVYEIMSKNMVEPERPQTIWLMRLHSCSFCADEASNTILRKA